MNTAICMIVKNERPYLVEWLAWHRLMGVQHFYVYDNDSDDGTSALLELLDDLGLLKRIHFPRPPSGRPLQLDAYRDCINRFGHRHDFVGFIDADELVVPKAAPSIPALLAKVPADHSALALHWKCFGSSGHTETSDLPMVERFVQAARSKNINNNWVKSFVRPQYLEEVRVHGMHMTAGHYQVDAALKQPAPCIGVWPPPPAKHKFGQVNHYSVKSKEEFQAKCARGRSAFTMDDDHQSMPKYWTRFDLNEARDECALQHLAGLKSEMQRIEHLLAAECPDTAGVTCTIDHVEQRFLTGHITAPDNRIRQIRILQRGRLEAYCWAYRHPSDQWPRTYRFRAELPAPLREDDRLQVSVRGSNVVIERPPGAAV